MEKTIINEGGIRIRGLDFRPVVIDRRGGYGAASGALMRFPEWNSGESIGVAVFGTRSVFHSKIVLGKQFLPTRNLTFGVAEVL